MKLAKKLGGMAATCLLLPSLAFAEVIFIEDFEDTLLSYTSSSSDALADITRSDYYGVVSQSQLPADVVYKNHQGNYFYGVQDTDGALPTPQSQVTLTWQNINISQWHDLMLSWWLAEDTSRDGNEDMDGDSFFQIATQVDGLGYSPLFEVRSAAGTNSAPRVDTDFNGVGDGQLITDVFSQFNREIMLGDTLDISVTFNKFNAGDEDFAFDHLMLVGSPKAQAVQAFEPPSWLLLLIPCMMMLSLKQTAPRVRNQVQLPGLK